MCITSTTASWHTLAHIARTQQEQSHVDPGRHSGSSCFPGCTIESLILWDAGGVTQGFHPTIDSSPPSGCSLENRRRRGSSLLGLLPDSTQNSFLIGGFEIMVCIRGYHLLSRCGLIYRHSWRETYAWAHISVHTLSGHQESRV